MRHGAHIALIPNQLSPVHRDTKICMSLTLKGLPTPYNFDLASPAIGQNCGRLGVGAPMAHPLYRPYQML